MSAITFERNAAHLSDELGGSPPFKVHGVALGEGDVTKGSSGIKKLWPGEELRKAADSLQGRPLVIDHNNSVDGVVGKVTKAGYKDGVGVIYEAELHDEDLARKVDAGLLEVSIRGAHSDLPELEEDDETDALVVKNIKFDNLSLVPSGAAPSNFIEVGAASELSAAELSDAVDQLQIKSSEVPSEPAKPQHEEMQEFRNGDLVSWGDMQGMVIDVSTESPIERDGTEYDVDGASEDDPALLVRVYEEQDEGEWMPIEEVEAVLESGVDSWDVELEDISTDGVELEHTEPASMEHTLQVGHFVQWGSGRGSTKGRVLAIIEEGRFAADTVGAIDAKASPDDPAALLAVYKNDGDGGWFNSGKLVSRKLSSLKRWSIELSDRPEGAEERLDMREFSDEMPHRYPKGLADQKKEERDDELAEHGPPEWNEGQLVKWQVEPSLFGKIVHVDDEKDIVMVDVHERNGGELESTGFTITAGYSDLTPMENVNMSEETEELQEISVHEPEWDDTRSAPWNEPSLEDWFSDMTWDELDEEDKQTVAAHFLVSKSGFPPENFGDLALPVVDSEGNLVLNALQNAKARAGQVSGLGGDTLERVENMIDRLANDNFEDANFGDGEEEMSEHAMDGCEGDGDCPDGQVCMGGECVPEEEAEEMSDETEEEMEEDTDSVVDATVISSLSEAGADEPEAIVYNEPIQLTGDTMNEELEEKIEELEEPTVIESGVLEELRQKAERFDDVDESLESLRERTEILDEVDRDALDELREADDAVILDAEEYEQLSDEAAQVKRLYAERVAEELGAFEAEELEDKFSMEELREKFEDLGGDLEEELDPEPKSDTPEEEELEEQVEEEETEELSDEIAAKQEELRAKIGN